MLLFKTILRNYSLGEQEEEFLEFLKIGKNLGSKKKWFVAQFLKKQLNYVISDISHLSNFLSIK